MRYVGLAVLFVASTLVFYAYNIDVTLDVEMRVKRHEQRKKIDYHYQPKSDLKPEVLEAVRKRWIVAPSTGAAYNMDLDKYYGDSNTRQDRFNDRAELEQTYFDTSEVEQSQYIEMIFKSKKNGFFIECGAVDGEQFSNTVYLERKLGWGGLLIEANPTFFRAMRKKNRRAYLSNVCLSDRFERTRFVATGTHGGLRKTLKKGHRTFLRHRYRDVTEIEATCFPLYYLLKAINVTDVDYFSLDVEGAELKILRSIPFHLLNIKVIGLEYRCVTWSDENANPEREPDIDFEATLRKLNRIRRLFEETGLYEEITILPASYDEASGLDVFFKRKGIEL